MGKQTRMTNGHYNAVHVMHKVSQWTTPGGKLAKYSKYLAALCAVRNVNRCHKDVINKHSSCRYLHHETGPKQMRLNYELV